MTTAYITDSRFAVHTLKGHAESAARLDAIHDTLSQFGVVEQTLALTPCEATLDQLKAVHSDEYLELLAWTATQDGMQLGSDTYVLPESFGVAKLASGAAIDAVDAVMKRQAQNALVCARPPGHHATPTMGMGFCLVNNIAIAARHAQKAYHLDRVLIVDYDVHHGNGTQDVFYSDPSVLFISTHQFPWYPGTGNVDEMGAGAGKGTTLNIPLSAGTGDKGYKKIYSDLIWPAATRFQPELILVSAGFDAHWADPLGQIQLTLPGYAHLTRELISMADKLCGGKIIFVLEGGYNLTSLSHGVLNVLYALLGQDKVTDPLGPTIRKEPDVTDLIDQIKKLHHL